MSTLKHHVVAAMDAVVLTKPGEHITRIETEIRGQQVGNSEHHIYHRYVCSCGVAGSWGHSLWTKVSRASAEQTAANHVESAQWRERER